MYLEAQSEVAKRIKEIYLQKNEICSLPIDISSFTSSGILQQLLLNPDINLIEQIIHEALSCLLGEVKEIAEDERIKNIRYIITTLNIEELNISSLASKIYLSESRLRSLFKKSVGVSLHKYIVWHKIIRGINSIINGASVLEAALNAGFSDSSHFHKMTVKMFGVSPSQFIKNNKNLKIIICDNLPMKMETTFYNEKIIPVEKKKW
jgi:AraC-like DNA-binding protein